MEPSLEPFRLGMGLTYTLLLNSPIHKHRQCPRASSAAIVFDKKLSVLGSGRNLLNLVDSPCTCDSGEDTLIAGSPTCKAIHAEMSALGRIPSYSKGEEWFMFTTRPPCKKCLPILIESDVKFIITTDQLPDRDGSQLAWPGVWHVLPYSEFL